MPQERITLSDLDRGTGDWFHGVYQTGCRDLGILTCGGCPLRRCRYDMAPGVARTELLAQSIRRLAAQGASAAQIAVAIRRSVRSVYRIARVHGIRLGDGTGADGPDDGSEPHGALSAASKPGITISAHGAGSEEA